MFNKTKFSIGIDIDANPIKWVLLAKHNQQIQHLTAETGSPKGLKFLKRCFATMAIQDVKIMCQSLNISSELSDQDVLLKIKLMSEKLFSLAAEKLSYDFYKIANDQAKVFASYQAEVLLKQQQANSVGTKLACLEPASHALARAFVYYAKKTTGTLLDVNQNNLQCICMRQGEIQWQYAEVFDSLELGLGSIKQQLSLKAQEILEPVWVSEALDNQLLEATFSVDVAGSFAQGFALSTGLALRGVS